MCCCEIEARLILRFRLSVPVPFRRIKGRAKFRFPLMDTAVGDRVRNG